jgi:hypothetical protein
MLFYKTHVFWFNLTMYNPWFTPMLYVLEGPEAAMPVAHVPPVMAAHLALQWSPHYDAGKAVSIYKNLVQMPTNTDALAEVWLGVKTPKSTSSSVFQTLIEADKRGSTPWLNTARMLRRVLYPVKLNAANGDYYLVQTPAQKRCILQTDSGKIKRTLKLTGQPTKTVYDGMVLHRVETSSKATMANGDVLVIIETAYVDADRAVGAYSKGSVLPSVNSV